MVLSSPNAFPLVPIEISRFCDMVLTGFEHGYSLPPEDLFGCFFSKKLASQRLRPACSKPKSVDFVREKNRERETVTKS
jgi:hypothetical protein